MNTCKQCSKDYLWSASLALMKLDYCSGTCERTALRYTVERYVTYIRMARHTPRWRLKGERGR